VLYDLLKEPLLRLLRAPLDPPQAPLGSPESVRVFRASPRHLALELVLHFTSMATALGFEVAFWAISPGPATRMLGALVSSGVLATTFMLTVVRYFLIRLDYDMRFYVVTDRSLRIRRGALKIEESTYTFANVQNLTLRQGPLESLFGLTHLHIDTAGGNMPSRNANASNVMDHRGRLDGIDGPTARELRDQIISRIKTHSGAGLGDPEARRSARDATAEQARTRVLAQIVDELRALNANDPKTGPE
jgi:membrane protein YdbS with pleckstrin-like domain